MKSLGAVLKGSRCHFRVWAPLAREVLAREDDSTVGPEPGPAPGAEPGPHGGTKAVLWMTHTSTGLGLTDTVVSLQRMGEVRRC